MPLYGARLFNSRHYAQVCQFFQLILSKNFIWRMHLFLQKLFHKKKTFKFKLKKKLWTKNISKQHLQRVFSMLLNYGMIRVTNISVVSYSTEKKIES